jgi:hypothetical protein
MSVHIIMSQFHSPSVKYTRANRQKNICSRQDGKRHVWLYRMHFAHKLDPRYYGDSFFVRYWLNCSWNLIPWMLVGMVQNWSVSLSCDRVHTSRLSQYMVWNKYYVGRSAMYLSLRIQELGRKCSLSFSLCISKFNSKISKILSRAVYFLM